MVPLPSSFCRSLALRLQRNYPERLPVLHRRACRWYADAGDPDEAMRHASAIPDPTLAADLAEQYSAAHDRQQPDRDLSGLDSENTGGHHPRPRLFVRGVAAGPMC